MSFGTHAVAGGKIIMEECIYMHSTMHEQNVHTYILSLSFKLTFNFKMSKKQCHYFKVEFTCTLVGV